MPGNYSLAKQFVLVSALVIVLFAPGASWASLNILFILTDDQRFDTLWAMPQVQARLVQNGVSFSNAYASTPQCCPFRSSVLSGGYLAHDTGVLTAQAPNGGSQNFNHNNTIATRLQAAGYSNAMIGKYFASFDNSFTPPGWDRFIHFPNTNQDTSALTAEALQFLDQHDTAEPFMLLFSTVAPHHPAIPAPQHENAFPGYVYRGRGYTETDLSDKPGWVANNTRDYDHTYFSNLAEQDEFHRDQLRALLGVDDAVDAILDKLIDIGEINNTVIIFASDNGYLWGEHRQFGKNKPYEEALRVPLVIVYPGIAPRVDDSLVVANIDLGATIQDIAGITGNTDGSSLLPLLSNPVQPSWRTEMLIEQYRNGKFNSAWSNLPWAGLIRKHGSTFIKYIRYAGGAEELYDLASDPYELENRKSDAAYSAIKNDLYSSLQATQGLAITSFRSGSYPVGLVGAAFQYQLTAWGGDGNYSWSIDSGALPAGVTLNPVTGLISGVPEQAGSFTVVVAVEDTALALHTGLPQRLVQEYKFDVTDQDSDSDGLMDSVEYSLGTNPGLIDTDGDGLSDYDEVNRDGDPGNYTAGIDTDPGVDPVTPIDPAVLDPTDTDGDGIGDASDPLPTSPLGDANNDGSFNAADLLIANQVLLNLRVPDADLLLRLDIAPLVNSAPMPDGQINAADVLLLERLVNEQAP